MGIFDWLRAHDPEPPKPTGISRRDFFARVAGQAAGPAPAQPEDPSTGALYSFHVSRFPYHDGPVLVPLLRPGIEFMLVPDPSHLTDPTAVRIQWGKDHLGYVPPEHSADVRRRLADGEKLVCRSVSVDPAADLPRVLKVEIRQVEEPEAPGEPEFVAEAGAAVDAAEADAPADSTGSDAPAETASADESEAARAVESTEADAAARPDRPGVTGPEETRPA